MNVGCNWNEQMFQYCSTVFSNRHLVLFFSSTLSLQSRFFSFPSADSSLFFAAILSSLLLLTPRLCALCCGCAEWLTGALQAMEEMDSKPYQPLSKGRHEMEMSYTSSSDESEDGRAHHRSYTSRETLPDYTHELRLTLGSHRERQSNYSQPQPGTTLRACLGCKQYLPENIHPTSELTLRTNEHCHTFGGHTFMDIWTHTPRSLKGPMWISYYSLQWARRTVRGSQLPPLHGGDISLPQLN